MGKISKLGRDSLLGSMNSAGRGPAESKRESYYVWEYDEVLDQTVYTGVVTYEQVPPGPNTLHLTEEQHWGVLESDTARFEIAEKP